jgi:hypothetical protein
MNGHKSSSIFCCFLVFYVLMAAGCTPSSTLKRYGTLPPTVKEAMVVKLQGTEPEMVNSGIYLNEGEPYSIVAAGVLYSRGGTVMYLNEGFLLEARIGQKPYFTPLSGTYYNLNGTTRIAHANGNLYLALDVFRRLGTIAIGNIEVRVLIIAWKTDDMAQIVGSLQGLKEKEANSFEAGRIHSDFINGFDDAIDRTKELRHDFGFRISEFGFAPEIVCVKNYRRVTP